MHRLAGESAAASEDGTLQPLKGSSKKLRSGGGGGSPAIVCESVLLAAQPNMPQMTTSNMSSIEGITFGAANAGGKWRRWRDRRKPSDRHCGVHLTD